MKLNGSKIQGANEEIIVLPRGNDSNLVFKVRAVLDYTDFENLCPRPEPPTRMLPGDVMQRVTTDPDYLKKLDEWAKRRSDFMILKSLEATTELEWESVEMCNPSTWGGFLKELREGFTEPEIDRLLGAVFSVNGLNSAKIEQATQDFLATMEAARKEQSSLRSEPSVTPSGEPVSV